MKLAKYIHAFAQAALAALPKAAEPTKPTTIYLIDDRKQREKKKERRKELKRKYWDGYVEKQTIYDAAVFSLSSGAIAGSVTLFAADAFPAGRFWFWLVGACAFWVAVIALSLISNQCLALLRLKNARGLRKKESGEGKGDSSGKQKEETSNGRMNAKSEDEDEETIDTREDRNERIRKYNERQQIRGWTIVIFLLLGVVCFAFFMWFAIVEKVKAPVTKVEICVCKGTGTNCVLVANPGKLMKEEERAIGKEGGQVEAPQIPEPSKPALPKSFNSVQGAFEIRDGKASDTSVSPETAQ